MLVEEACLLPIGDADQPRPGERRLLDRVGQALQVVLDLGETDRSDAHAGLIGAAVAMVVLRWVLIVVVVAIPAGHDGSLPPG
jgi:hypothetical protein